MIKGRIFHYGKQTRTYVFARRRRNSSVIQVNNKDITIRILRMWLKTVIGP